MAVRIRLSRFGRLHRPYFRIVAIDGRCHREGRASEILGSYDPQLKDKNIAVDIAKVEEWVNRGAQISVGLRSLLKFQGYAVPEAKKTVAAKAEKPAAKAKAKKAAGKDKPKWVPPTRRALRKHAAKVKAVAKAALAAQVAAKQAEKPAEAAPAAEAPKT